MVKGSEAGRNMSDGENATPGLPGRHGPPDTGGDNQWLTRSRRPSPGAAPWERSGNSDSEDVEKGAQTGSHTDGVTVADLIAKLHGAASVPEELRRPRPEPEPRVPPPAPPAPPTEVIEAVGADPEDPVTEVIPVVAGYTSEVPDLAALRRRDRVQPSRVGRRRSSAQSKPRRGRRSKTVVAGRVAAALIAVSALALTGGAWQWQSSKNSMLNKVSALDLGSRDILDPNAQFGDENFLIVGVDSRFGENSDMGAGDTEDAGGSRSDTVMLVNIPANRKRVVAVSFPRDLAITPMQCRAWNPETGQYGPLYDEETGTYGPDEVYTETKLNSAYSVGGPKCLVKVIQKLSGLSVNRFMAVDFAGFSKMVDAIGGVEVCSTAPLKDYELGTVLAHSGRQLIDSKTALNYVRARNVTTENNGDYGRIKRQQLFLSSLLRSLISKDTFFSLSKLNNVVNMFISNSYVDNVKTKDLVQLGQSVQGMSAGHVSFVTVPTGVTDENGDETPRTSDMRALFDAIINDDPLPGENDLNATSSPPTKSLTSKAPQASPSAVPHPEQVQAVTAAPQDVTVQVSNSTAKSGLAAIASTELKHHGFKVKTPDDYPSSLKSTTVFFSPGNEKAAATVAASLANPKVERVTGIGHVVQVVLGLDFSSVSAPPPAGSSVSVQVDRNTSTPPTKLPEDLSVTNAADTTCE